jgi:fructose-1-phosphate kinase PfkB-like protein
VVTARAWSPAACTVLLSWTRRARGIKASPTSPVPYPVGSGRAVLGALAVARTRGERWDAALRAAVGAGAANAARPGAGVVDLTDARAVARMLTVRRVGA